jgi:hypothetical protein
MRKVGLDALVRASRRANAPPDDARERNRAQLARRIALGAVAGAAASSVRPAAAAVGGVTPAAGATATAWLTTKWVVVSIVIAVGGGTGALLARGSHTAPTDQHAPGPSALPPAPLATSPALEPRTGSDDEGGDTAPPVASPDYAPVSPFAPAPAVAGEPSVGDGSGRSRGPSPEARSFERELQLVRSAQRAIDRGSPALALTLIDQHAAEFPRGRLNHECEAIRVVALCAAGRVASSHEARDRFLQQHPSSPLAARVRATCGGH